MPRSLRVSARIKFTLEHVVRPSKVSYIALGQTSYDKYRNEKHNKHILAGREIPIILRSRLKPTEMQVVYYGSNA